MAYVAHPSDFHGTNARRRPAHAASEAAPARPGLLRRIYDAIVESRQQRVQREIERIVGQRGRQMTDSLERDINARMFNSGWNSRQ